jgi:hypothetical protein
MKKADSNFKLSKANKLMLGSIQDKELRRLWKKAFINAELNEAPRMTMAYDIGPNGKPPRKVTEKQNANG